MADTLLQPDRLFPADPTVRALARTIHAGVADAPIVSPHGHVDPDLFVRDEPFGDPTSLLISSDHYVTRLLHARGVALADLGVGGTPLDEAGSRRAFTALCEAWESLAGTAVRGWLAAQLAEVFDIDTMPSAATAPHIYETIADALARPEFRPRALYERFGLSVLATTDDPCSDLAAHRALAADPGWSGRIIPTFRPDALLEPLRSGWVDRVDRLGEVADIDTGTYDGYLAALAARRRFFIAHGATSADHSHDDVGTTSLSIEAARRIFNAARRGEGTIAEMITFRRHMLGEMAVMSCEDGLVMTLHCGVVRNHHRPSFERFGADIGADLPRRIDFVEPLRPLLERCGTHPGFRLVCFTVDETAWSRELVPLAGFYPSVHVGVPWWFLDAPGSLARFWEDLFDGVGYSRSSGFVDDTRALCSIPARHDTARRIEAGVLARLVIEGRVAEEEAHRIAARLVGEVPRTVFGL